MRWLACVLVLAACAKVPPNRYGVDHLRIEGMETMDERSLRACLATSERPRRNIALGIEENGACGEPPFDAGHVNIPLGVRRLLDWHLLDRVALEQDLARIERWYHARGFHAVEITDISVTPERATDNDVIDPDADDPGCERIDDDEGCVADVSITLIEGEPTLVQSIEIQGIEGLPGDVQEELHEAIELEVAGRADEALYDRSKVELARVLANEGYARAKIRGRMYIHRGQREARVRYHVEPGPLCTFGEVEVSGNEDLSAESIVAAARIFPGDEYRYDTLREAQRAIFGLGAFSAVVVEPVLIDPDDSEGDRSVIDVRVAVTPAQRHRFGLGFGVQSGIVQRGDFEPISVPLWDLHLTLRYENRNMAGGLRRLLLENKPRLIIQEPFPGFEQPRFGNLLSAEFRQPGFLEPRTTLVLGASHEFGPDPFDTFFRHRVDARVLLERFFFKHKLFASFGLRSSFYRVPSGEVANDGSEPPSDSDLMYFEEVLRLDLRDDANRPHAGLFVQVAVQQAGYFLLSSWDYVRLLPDVRAYIPLPKKITIAARFAMGMYFITDADGDLDDVSQELGPRDLRIRGGGPTSNRGYLAGRLGDGRNGGVRRWESSLEVRFPITASFGGVLFGDVGDVSRSKRFRFDHPQTSVGFGFRYHTIVGAIRADFAFRVTGATVIGEDERIRRTSDDTEVSLGFTRWPGAFHLSIGESF